MDTIIRRATTAAMALTLALVLALGAVAFAPEGAAARPMDGFGYDSCMWEGKAYSEGAVVKQGDGKTYRCRSGKWVKYNHVYYY